MLASRRRQIAIAGLFLVIALAQTAPVLSRFASHIPYGNYPASTTVRYALWTLWWNSESLSNGYVDYWKAPTFYPEQNALVYSEPQWFTGLIFSPIHQLTQNPALAYNLLLVAILALNGWCGFYLFRQLHLSFWPALCGGVMMEMLPIVADQLGVIHTLALFPCSMVLAKCIQFRRSPAWPPLLECGVWMAVLFHSSAHSALLFGPLALCGFVILAARRLANRRTIFMPLAAAVLTGLLIAPVALKQRSILGDLDMSRSRSPKVISNTSARISDFQEMPASNWLRQRAPDRRGWTLGPGLAILPIALAGIWFGWSRRRYRPWTLLCLVATFAGVVLSFGPNAVFPLVLPYELLRACYPGFEYARNLWRFAGLAQIFLVGLAALGLALLYRVRRPWRLPAVLILTLAVTLDWFSAPVPLLEIGSDRPKPEWIEWLQNSPEGTRYVHVPMSGGGRADEFERTTLYMTYQMYHGKSMANGFASYSPMHTKRLALLMMRFPSAESISALRRLGITHALMENDWYAQREGTFEIWKDHMELVRETPAMKIFRVSGSQGR